MKVRHYLYAFIAAAVMLIMSPVTMADTGYVTGANYYQVTTVDDVMSVNASGIATAKSDCIQAAALYVPATAYEKPRISALRLVHGNSKAFNDVTAKAQAKPYAGVTAA